MQNASLLRIFAQFKKKCLKSKLVLVGAGNLMEDIKSYAIELGMRCIVMFYFLT